MLKNLTLRNAFVMLIDLININDQMTLYCAACTYNTLKKQRLIYVETIGLKKVLYLFPPSKVDQLLFSGQLLVRESAFHIFWQY